MKQGDKLLRTPRPYSDESFKGYILRLTEENGYDTPSWILQMIGINVNGFYLETAFPLDVSTGLSNLARISRVDKSVLNDLTYTVAPTGGMERKYLVYGHPVPRYLIRYSHSKICPECLKESGHMRRIWELAPVTACPVHKRLLFSRCPACDRKISWNRMNVSVCACKFDWRGLHSEPIEDDEIILSGLIYRLCGLLKEFESSENLTKKSLLGNLGMEDMLKVLFFIAGRYRRIVDTKGKVLATSLENHDLQGILTKAFDVFRDWPTRYYEFLDSIRAHAQDQKPGSSTGLIKDFGSFYTTLYRNFKDDKYDFLRSEFEDFLINRWHGGYLSSRCRFLGKTDLQKKKYVSKREAAKRLGLSFTWIPRLIENGSLKGVAGAMGKREFCLVERSSLEQLEIELRDALSTKEVAGQLWIGKRNVRKLASDNLLMAIRGRTGDGCCWQFNRVSIDLFLKKIGKGSVPIQMSTLPGTVEFHIAIKCLSPLKMTMSDFLTAVLAGGIRACGHDFARGLSGFYFSEEDILNYLNSKIMEQREGLHSITEAAKLLRIKEQVCYGLAKKGLLPTEKRIRNGQNCLYVSGHSVEEFKSTYIILSDIARKQKTSPRYLAETLMNKGVHPVTGPTVDGGRQYIFRKSEVEKALSFHLQEL